MKIVVEKKKLRKIIGNDEEKIVERGEIKIERKNGGRKRDIDIEIEVGKIEERRIVDGVSVEEKE